MVSADAGANTIDTDLDTTFRKLSSCRNELWVFTWNYILCIYGPKFPNKQTEPFILAAAMTWTRGPTRRWWARACSRCRTRWSPWTFWWPPPALWTSGGWWTWVSWGPPLGPASSSRGGWPGPGPRSGTTGACSETRSPSHLSCWPQTRKTMSEKTSDLLTTQTGERLNTLMENEDKCIKYKIRWWWKIKICFIYYILNKDFPTTTKFFLFIIMKDSLKLKFNWSNSSSRLKQFYKFTSFNLQCLSFNIHC